MFIFILNTNLQIFALLSDILSITIECANMHSQPLKWVRWRHVFLINVALFSRSCNQRFRPGLLGGHVSCKMIYEMWQHAKVRWVIKTHCGSGLLPLNFIIVWWTMQMISGKKGWKHVSTQKNTWTLTVLLLLAEVYTPHNHLLSELPTFWRKQYTYDQMNAFCILQGSAVTLFSFSGKFTVILAVCFMT